MKTYLEIRVPIKYDDSWFVKLRSHFSDIPVRWQKGYYHITMAFLDETPEQMDLHHVMEKHLSTAFAPVLTFDKLDVFQVGRGSFIIHLTASSIPNDFLDLTNSIRNDLKAAGCQIQSRFMLHVTLGRARDPKSRLSTLKKKISSVPSPSLTLTLTDVDFVVFRGKMLYEFFLKNR